MESKISLRNLWAFVLDSLHKVRPQLALSFWGDMISWLIIFWFGAYFKLGEKCLLNTGNDAQGKNDPKDELREAHKPDADDLTHHQLEWPDGRYYDFNDPAGFFLDDTAHHHGPEKKDEEVDEHASSIAYAHGKAGMAFFLRAFLAECDVSQVDLCGHGFQNYFPGSRCAGLSASPAPVCLSRVLEMYMRVDMLGCFAGIKDTGVGSQDIAGI